MPNLSDVAKRARVSVSTASAVMRGEHAAARITDLCALRVRQAAQELGYTPNYHARSMRLGRAHVIGFAMQLPGVSETGSLYFNGLFGGVHAAIQDEGYHLMLIRSAGNIGAVETAVKGVRQQMLDGLIIPGQAGNLRSGDVLARREVQDLPAVVVDPVAPTNLPCVALDEGEGMRAAVEHLTSLGHRHALWLGPDFWGANTTTQREQAFITAAWDAGLQGVSLRYPDLKTSDRIDDACEAADNALSERLRRRRDFTAIVSFNDFVAIGALRALHRAGLRVPEEVSVVGFDDSPIAQAAMPPLTTVSHRLTEMGEKAGRLILEVVAGREEVRDRLRGHREVVAPSLEVRNSTGIARASA